MPLKYKTIKNNWCKWLAFGPAAVSRAIATAAAAAASAQIILLV